MVVAVVAAALALAGLGYDGQVWSDRMCGILHRGS